jgi:hypothetical protein
MRNSLAVLLVIAVSRGATGDLSMGRIVWVQLGRNHAITETYPPLAAAGAIFVERP